VADRTVTFSFSRYIDIFLDVASGKAALAAARLPLRTAALRAQQHPDISRRKGRFPDLRLHVQAREAKFENEGSLDLFASVWQKPCVGFACVN